MRRTLALLLVVVLALGGMVYVHASIGALTDDVTFTEEPLAGDKAWMDGYAAELSYEAAARLKWNCRYHFGDEPRTETEFHLDQSAFSSRVQRDFDPYLDVRIGGLSIYDTTPIENYPDELPITEIYRTAVLELNNLPDGSSLTFPITNCTDYHPYDLDLQYWSEKIWCQATLDGYLWQDGSSPDQQAFCRDFQSAFRFPVQPGEEAEIIRWGFPTSTCYNYDPIGIGDFGFLRQMNDAGLYLIPFYLDENGQPLPMIAPEGRGLYFLPWKEVSQPTEVTRTFNGIEITTPDYLPDVQGMKNLLPIPDDVRVHRLELSADGTLASVLLDGPEGLELQVVELSSGRLRSRIPVTEALPSRAYIFFGFRQDDLLVVSVSDRMALIDLSDGSLVFETGSAEAAELLPRFHSDQLTIRYEDGVLRLLGTVTPRYEEDERSFWLPSFVCAVFNPEGLQYLGAYHCNLDVDFNVCSWYPSNRFLPMTLTR